jgi:hypothetical protein
MEATTTTGQRTTRPQEDTMTTKRTGKLHRRFRVHLAGPPIVIPGTGGKTAHGGTYSTPYPADAQRMVGLGLKVVKINEIPKPYWHGDSRQNNRYVVNGNW